MPSGLLPLATRRLAVLTPLLESMVPDVRRQAQEVILSQRSVLRTPQAAVQAKFERALGIRADVENPVHRSMPSSAERVSAEAALECADVALDLPAAGSS